MKLLLKAADEAEKPGSYQGAGQMKDVPDKETHEKYVKLWRYFIATLDEQEHDWRGSQKSIAVSLLEVFDKWLEEREKRHNEVPA